MTARDLPQGLATPPAERYDPRYDPLVDATPGRGRAYAPTYWVATAGTPPPDDGPIDADRDVDVAIVGGGFTGLATALFLAREHGIRAAVLDANRSAWGCTSRNGGQGQNASGRLYRSQWIERWGKETALALHAEIDGGFRLFEDLVSNHGIDCDAQTGGHLLVAHRPHKMAWIESEARVMERDFGMKVEVLGKAELERRWLHDRDGHGALHEADGIGVHPLKLAFGYQRIARAHGATVHPASPVTGWETRDGEGPYRHRLRTPGGIVRARAVGICTGGYTAPGLHPSTRHRLMPILSNSVVTRRLTPAEIEAAGLRTRQVITDTRTLRFYYRLLPDDRLQIGSRSAITGADAEAPRHLKVLTDAIARKFPPLAGIPIEHSWWGWVDVSHDMMPRVTQPDPGESVFYAMGYGGNGVAYSARAGQRLAQRIAGRRDPVDALPIHDSPLPAHPLRPFRRMGQRMLYRYYALRDEKL